MGQPVPQHKMDEMTELWRRVRQMTEEVGIKRGRPILIGIRIPDSMDYCRAMGLDVERWLEDDLIDLVTGAEDPVFDAKIYTSVGLAVRIQNLDLVFPATQLRVAFLNSIDDKGIVLGFEVGGISRNLVQVPGTRPGGFSFR